MENSDRNNGGGGETVTKSMKIGNKEIDNANGNANDNASVIMKPIGKENESGGASIDNNSTDTTVTNGEVGHKPNCCNNSGYNGKNNNKNTNINNSNKGNNGTGFVPIYVPISHMLTHIIILMVIHNMVICNILIHMVMRIHHSIHRPPLCTTTFVDEFVLCVFLFHCREQFGSNV